MELMDRAYQRALLTTLAQQYPDELDAGQLGADSTDRSLSFNVSYLHEHGLVVAKFAQLLGVPPQLVLARATHRGLDFLQDDGGLGAILNVVTVRLDAQQLRALITERVENSALPAEEKSRLKRWLQEAGQEGLKEATTRLVGAALDQAPGALQLLQKLLGPTS